MTIIGKLRSELADARRVYVPAVGVRSPEELAANQAAVDALFGGSRSKAWERLSFDLALSTPPLVFDIVRQAQIETRVQPVLAMNGALSLPVLLGQGAFWTAVTTGVSYALSLPSIVSLPLTVAMGAALLFPKYDPVLALVGKLTGIRAFTSIAGEVSPENRRLIVHTPLFDRFDVQTKTVTHEIVHVIDFACGDGLGLSAEPEFLALYDAVCADETKRPSDYALKSARELFAEAGAAYLGVDRNLSRSELLDRNPELHAYFQNLFEHRLPQIVAAGKVRASADWPVDVAGEMSLHHPRMRAIAVPMYAALEIARALEASGSEIDEGTRDKARAARDRLAASLENVGQPPRGIAFDFMPQLVAAARTMQSALDEVLAKP